MIPRQTCWGLAIAAGLVGMGPASSARAQYSFGYDSFLYDQMPSQTYWAGQGYSPTYTDPSLGIHADGMPAQYRGLTPYMEPPYGAFPQGNGLPVVVTRPGAAVVQPAPAGATVRKKKGIFRRNVRR